uniref:Uncharacterized protein n=1 Tax=Rhizophora mucronata TaxID=61149 RepID=A0A2P2PS00_RHIMU
MDFKSPHDLVTDSESFSFSGARPMKDRFQQSYLQFCPHKPKKRN